MGRQDLLFANSSSRKEGWLIPAKILWRGFDISGYLESFTIPKAIITI